MSTVEEIIARAISGAPFPSKRSLAKAQAVLTALSEAGMAVVPMEPSAEMVATVLHRPTGDAVSHSKDKKLAATALFKLKKNQEPADFANGMICALDLIWDYRAMLAAAQEDRNAE